jgi:hypothetical protein
MSAELFTTFFAESRPAPEFDPCATLGLSPFQSSTFETIRMQLNVRAKLLLQFAIDRGPATKSPA